MTALIATLGRLLHLCEGLALKLSALLTSTPRAVLCNTVLTRYYAGEKFLPESHPLSAFVKYLPQSILRPVSAWAPQRIRGFSAICCTWTRIRARPRLRCVELTAQALAWASRSVTRVCKPSAVTSLGASGVRAELLRHLVGMLERDLLPVVPSRGSLGASGDLIPLAHLALAVVGEGEIRRGGVAAPAADQYRAAGWAPIPLQAKEGLSLINGTQAATAAPHARGKSSMPRAPAASQ